MPPAGIMAEDVIGAPGTGGTLVPRPGWRPSSWRVWLERAAMASGSPHRTAAAFALGVFLSFSPFLGLQVAIGMAAAFALRMSKATVFVGLCTNVPAIMVPWYAMTTAAGAFLLERPVSPDFGARLGEVLALPAYRAVFWQQLLDLLWPFALAFVIGSTAGALIVGGAAYVSTARVLVRATKKC